MHAALLGFLVALAAPIDPPPAHGTEAPPRAFLGLATRDVPKVGCVVSWIDPGPLEGAGIESPTLARPDLIESIDGQPASGAAIAACLAAKKPGDSIALVWRRSNRRGGSFPDQPDFEATSHTMTVVLSDQETWRGTIGQPRLGPPHAPEAPPTFLAPTGDGPFARALAQLALQPALDGLVAAQQAVLAAAPDARRLGRVEEALGHPLSLPDLAERMAAPTASIKDRPWRVAAELAAANLDATLAPGESHGSVPINDPQGGIFALDFFLNEARLKMQDALGDRYANPAFARLAIQAARDMGEDILVHGPHAKDTLAVVRAGATIDMDAMVAAIAHLDAELGIGPELAKGEVEPPRDELKGLVEGDVLSSEEIPGIGWAVVGGLGPNRYDLSKIAAVLDVGGDDTYFMSDLALGMRGIIDLAGNDRYEGGPEQGIGCGVCGLFLVNDRGGNDTYVGRSLHAGCGVFGVGILVDAGGNDRYDGTVWTQGTALWGTGLLVDLGGSDLYRADFLSQGCGGPRGFGAVIDVDGNDRYDAIGAQPSAYDTPAVASSFSQGMGIGLRRFAAGGIGLLADLAGNDRYEGGEFAQGGGYYFGLGVLADRSGNDWYYGNRYAQGFAAHQAAGCLVDGGGNDTYLGMTAASQGVAWDQSVACLLDRSGDDSYQADGLSQGSAAQQALGFLIDLAGSDRYVAVGDSVQGASGTNEYHFAEPPPSGGIFSFSVLLDLGSGVDHFSSGRPSGTPIKTGTANAERPAYGTLQGLFFDARADTPADPRPEASGQPQR